MVATPRQMRSGGLGVCDPPPKTILICAKCRAIWKGSGSPAICPVCKQTSYPIVVKDEKK
jgi:rubrerythrin